MMEILSPPTLVPIFKNYWFIYGNEGPKQFFFMFGTAMFPFLKCNGYSGNYPNYAVVFWGYDPKEGKTVKLDTSMHLKFPFEEPFRFVKDNGNFLLQYDDTDLTFGKDYKDPYTGTFGGFARMNNEYREVKGKLFGKKFNGRSYFQKVESWAPFFPSWDWMRFHGKGVCDLFNVHGLFKTVLHFNKEDFPVKVDSDDGALQVYSDDVDLRTEPYEDHLVTFKWLLPKFKYKQHLVKVEGKIGKTKVKDYGLVEEARLALR